MTGGSGLHERRVDVLRSVELRAVAVVGLRATDRRISVDLRKAESGAILLKPVDGWRMAEGRTREDLRSRELEAGVGLRKAGFRSDNVTRAVRLKLAVALR